MDDMVLVVREDLAKERCLPDARCTEQDGEPRNGTERPFEDFDLGRPVKKPR